MKIHGGIKGIVNNQLAQDQNFILTPELSSIIEKFYTFFGITDTEDQEHHYQLKGSKNKRIEDNVEKLMVSITPSLKRFYQKNLLPNF